MNKDKILKLISKTEKALTELKAEIVAPGRIDSINEETSKTLRKSVSRGKKKQGSTKPIEKLIASGFFKSTKTDLEVLAALKKMAIPFKREGVAITLMRFVRKGLLEREGDGTKGSPWRYKKT